MCNKFTEFGRVFRDVQADRHSGQNALYPLWRQIHNNRSLSGHLSRTARVSWNQEKSFPLTPLFQFLLLHFHCFIALDGSFADFGGYDKRLKCQCSSYYGPAWVHGGFETTAELFQDIIAYISVISVVAKTDCWQNRLNVFDS